MEISGDPGTVASWLGEPSAHPLEGIEVDWVDGDEPGVVAVYVTSANGTVRLD
jgi:hypothetical protein